MDSDSGLIVVRSHAGKQASGELMGQKTQIKEPSKYRSWVMSRVRSKDTSPEIRVRSLIHRVGYRYRLHVGKLPGKPDIVMRKYRTVVFVNGCFWHRHPGCRQASTPKTNVDYWNEKFERNVSRAKKNHETLEQDGWRVVVIWECQTRNILELSGLLSRDPASRIR